MVCVLTPYRNVLIFATCEDIKMARLMVIQTNAKLLNVVNLGKFFLKKESL